MSADTPLEPRPDDYRDLISLARTLSIADTHLDAPPDDLWAGIEALVAAGPSAVRAPVTDTATGADVPAPAHAPGPRATVVQLDAVRRRRNRAVMALGAVAAVVLAVIGLVAFVRGEDDTSVTALDTISLANARTNQALDPEGVSSTGKATLVSTADGHYALDIDVRDLPAANDGFLELWIIDTNVKGMYSLGPLHGSGRYVLPDHVDPAGFPIVDVSIEPSDGAPAHSGKSILRGTLTI